MITTLRTLFRASAAEAEEALIDANGTRLLAQHLRDARTDVEQSRRMCASLMARRSAEDRRIEKLTEEVARREEQVRAALAADQSDLATDIADRIVILEDQRAQARTACQDLDTRIASLRERLSDADRRIATLAADLRMARAGALDRAAAHRTADGVAPCALNEAEDMAARVRALDTTRDEICAAMTELRTDPAGIDARANSAGIGDPDNLRRKAILARLSSKSE